MHTTPTHAPDAHIFAYACAALILAFHAFIAIYPTLVCAAPSPAHLLAPLALVDSATGIALIAIGLRTA